MTYCETKHEYEKRTRKKLKDWKDKTFHGKFFKGIKDFVHSESEDG